jgi:hypothetical protein
MSVSNQVVTNRVTLLIDDMWLKHIYDTMVPFVESEEILQILDKTEVEICADCQNYLTSDGEVVMDAFKCDAQQEYCLNCCGCEDHDTTEEGAWY